MLTEAPMTTILPVKDLDRARDFYAAKLGLEPQGLQADGKFLFRCGGAILALFPKPNGTKAEHTAVRFQVEDIVAEIRDLERRGVKFGSASPDSPRQDPRPVRFASCFSSASLAPWRFNA